MSVEQFLLSQSLLAGMTKETCCLIAVGHHIVIMGGTSQPEEEATNEDVRVNDLSH